MNRGTAIASYSAPGPILGLDICPTRSEKVAFLGAFSAGRWEPRDLGLPSGTTAAADRWESARPLVQRVHYEIDRGRGIDSGLANDLAELVGHVSIRPLPERRAIVYRYADEVAVVAQLAVEMGLDVRGGDDVRFCEVCEKRILVGRADQLTCSPACKRLRKRRIDRERYQSQKAAAAP